MTEISKLPRRSITLKEIPTRGWLWLERGQYFPNVAKAFRTVNRESKRIAEGPHGGVVSVITYEPCTPAGTAAVRAITGEPNGR